MKRVFLIVLDSFGIGELPDAAEYGDAGSNTLRAVTASEKLRVPNLERLGLYRIDGATELRSAKKEAVLPDCIGAYGRLAEASRGKDTTIGHWEIAGLVSAQAMPTFPEGFPPELLSALSKATGREILCNKPYSGTKVIQDYGQAHMETGALIVYTSADSVLQIAAHEAVVPLDELYRYCEQARALCQGEWGVGRIIARPFVGECPNFTRTAGRHDFSLAPTGKTMLSQLSEAGFAVHSIGKIVDIFAEHGITQYVRTSGNDEGITRTLERMKTEFTGLAFTNLVDFDMLYGHRNDVDGYAAALTAFDERLPELLGALQEEDLLLITADHGCDPSTPSTDHSREYVPLLAYGAQVKKGLNLGTRQSFADIGATILQYFGVQQEIAGTSFLSELLSK